MRPADDPAPTPHVLTLTGAGLDLAALVRVAGGVGVTPAPAGLARLADAQRAAARVSAQRAVYGRTTGVGAARGRPGSGSGLALLRAHAAGWGEPYAEPTVRAALAIRANQLLAGGSGAAPELATALAGLAGGPAAELPVVHRHGGLGTADLTALAEVGLTLAGERPARGGQSRRVLDIGPGDGLALLSSSAFTLAETALGTAALQDLARAASVTAALSWVALRGGAEAVGPAVGSVTPFPGARQVAETVRRLVQPEQVAALHVQDFYGLRAWPQGHGPMVDQLAHLDRVVTALVNASGENPLFTAGSGEQAAEVTHHGGFHTAYLAVAVDSALLAAARSAALVLSRVSHLLTDPAGGLPLFLAGPGSGAGGALIGEYVAASALGAIRGHAAAPVSVQSVSVSAGIEDDAPFTPVAAGRLAPVAEAYRRMLGVELVCAVRALRLRGAGLAGPLAEVLERCARLPADVADRDLAPDFDLGTDLVGQLAAWVSSASSGWSERG